MLVITEIPKVPTKIRKESNCEEINSWICACESNGDGKGDIGKIFIFCFFSQMVDKHEKLENPLLKQGGGLMNVSLKIYIYGLNVLLSVKHLKLF